MGASTSTYYTHWCDVARSTGVLCIILLYTKPRYTRLAASLIYILKYAVGMWELRVRCTIRVPPGIIIPGTGI